MAPTALRTVSASFVRGLSRRVVVTLAALAAMLAPFVVSAAPAQAAGLYIKPRVAYEVSVQNSVLTLMNQQRAAHGLPKLVMNWRLQKSARYHNAMMARYNTMSHQLRGEADFSRRISATGYNWSWVGENIGWNGSQRNRAGVLALQKLMYNEKAPYDGHRRNILSRNFKNVGVDVYFDSRNHKVWLTTDFGRWR